MLTYRPKILNYRYHKQVFGDKSEGYYIEPVYSDAYAKLTSLAVSIFRETHKNNVVRGLVKHWLSDDNGLGPI